jgi:ABC-2 type transport system permease protein
MSTFAGTRSLLRLALRLDRVRLSVWIFAIFITPAVTAAQYFKIYPTEADIAKVSSVLATPSLVAIGGPLFSPTYGGVTAWKIGATEFILAALMSILMVVRHTRNEEETGRAELLGATVVGRNAPLTAALLEMAIANGLIVVLTAVSLIGVGLPAAGSVALGVSIGLVGMTFAAIAAVTAQLTQSARGANGIASAVLAAAYLVRAVGDTGPTALTWVSPLGWGLHMRAYGGERWWIAGPFIVLAFVLIAVAYRLVAARDVGAGLLPDRAGPAVGASGLRTPLALAWRLHRGLLIGWTAGMFLSGLVLGGAAKGIQDADVSGNQQLTDMLARLGGTKAFVDAYLAAVFAIIGLTVAAYTVQATLRLRAEESAGRVEPLLATKVGRIQWAASHLFFAVVGTAILLVVAGIGGGLAYGGQIGDVGGQVGRLIVACLVQLPAVWVLAGFGTLLFGLVPRWTTVTWGALIACVFVLLIGALLGLNQRILDLSPFSHLPKLPGGTITAMPLVWLTVIAAALMVGGLTAFRRRDIG